MDTNQALRALGALAQESRLGTFRLLVRCGATGMPAGDIARALDVPHNTMSAHLSILANAGLIQARRNGRKIIYGIDVEGARALLAFLVEDCCQGRPDICAPLPDRDEGRLRRTEAR
ncbi:MAG: metalloregulator ArsR/SmtB family transcription factor [Alphaproteobacteria bacterium]